MKTTIRTLSNTLLALFLGTLLAGQAHGQKIYETNPYQNTIGVYDATSGAPINATFIAGLSWPFSIAVSGGHLYVTNNTGGTVGEYDATTGAPINASLITGLNAPRGIAVSGNTLYVEYNNTIGEYDATTGAPINAALVSGVNTFNLALSGGNLYVVSDGFDVPGSVAVYNATTGALVNPSLIPIENAVSIVVSGGNLWVGNNNDNVVSAAVGLYNATTGAPINAALIPGAQGGGAYGLALSGSNLFVSGGGGTIGEYNATTGVAVNASLVSIPANGAAFGIAVVDIYSAQVQQPINADGTSVFNVRRGVVPVKFTLTLNGVATCQLPSATIALTRTSGGTIGSIDESVYIGPADTGSNFRIDSCQYIYNLSASALGVGTYRVDILINGQVVGSATFQLK